MAWFFRRILWQAPMVWGMTHHDVGRLHPLETRSRVWGPRHDAHGEDGDRHRDANNCSEEER